MSFFILFRFFYIILLIDFASSAIPTPNQQLKNTTASQIPTYNIGIIFPNATAVKQADPSLGDMIVTNELAIQLANEAIKKSNILPGTFYIKLSLRKSFAYMYIIDVQLNFTRYYSDGSNPGKTAWVAVNMVENGVE